MASQTFDEETNTLQPLVLNHDLEQGNAIKLSTKKTEGFYQRLLLSIDEHTSIKKQVQVWRPRLEIILRLMLVGPFLDDFVHTAMNFSDQSKIVNPLLLTIGILIQSICSLCLLGHQYPDWSIKALITWIIVQPVLYGQLSNFKFIAESFSLIGGLLVLHSNLVCHSSADVTHMVGRLLLPSMYVHCAGHYLMSATTFEETNSYTEFLSSLSIFGVYILVGIGLLGGCCLIAAGLKSRYVALLLGLFNLCLVFYQHPFLCFIKLQDGEWKYDAENMSIPNVALPTDVADSEVVFDLEQAYNLHRYYFFMGLSNSGALLLLAYVGPGNFAMQQDEILFPEVSRARD